MKHLFGVALILLLAGCGYKPSSHYTRNILGHNIYTQINIPVDDPESSLLIIDAINEAVISKFKSRLSSKEAADTVLVVNKATFQTDGLQVDENGFTILYRTTSNLSVSLTTERLKKNFSVSGIYDFAVSSDSVVSEEKRLLSFKFATIKALDEIMPILASMGAASE